MWDHMSAQNDQPASMRSVHITNYYHESSGGISTSYNELLAAAELRGRHMSLIVPGEKDSIQQLGRFTRVYFVRSMRSPIIDRRYRLIMPWQYMPTRSKIKSILADERPDMIEVVDKYTIAIMGAMIRTGWFKQLGRPMLVHASCERMDDNIAAFFGGRSFATWVSRVVYSLYLLPSFDFHIANSDYTADEMRDARQNTSIVGGWISSVTSKLLKAASDNDNVILCPRGVDTVKFPPGRRDRKVRHELIAENGFSSSSKILIYAGRISREKNVGLLVEMMHSLTKRGRRDIKLLIAGAGPQETDIRRRLAAVDADCFRMLGHLGREKLADVIANSDAFVHPNPREPFGIGPLEAMAAGSPVVAPNAGGILTYANSENSWIVNPDGESFADAVIEATSNAEMRRAKIESALATAVKFDAAQAAMHQLRVYDEMYQRFIAAQSYENQAHPSISHQRRPATS